MDGVWIRKAVTHEEFEKIKKAEFVELRLETKDGELGEIIKLYPKKTIEEYF